jgi:glycerol transport system ATP-binding protein
VPVRRRSVAMVYQQFINYPNLTVYENIASPLRVAGVAKGERSTARARNRESREAHALARSQSPLELSGASSSARHGRAIVKGADHVCCLDEPLANLRTTSFREELRDELPRIFSATGSDFSSMPPLSHTRRCCSADRRPHWRADG